MLIKEDMKNITRAIETIATRINFFLSFLIEFEFILPPNLISYV